MDENSNLVPVKIYITGYILIPSQAFASFISHKTPAAIRLGIDQRKVKIRLQKHVDSKGLCFMHQ